MFPGRPGLPPDVRTSAWVAARCGIGAAAHEGVQAEPHDAGTRLWGDRAAPDVRFVCRTGDACVGREPCRATRREAVEHGLFRAVALGKPLHAMAAKCRHCVAPMKLTTP